MVRLLAALRRMGCGMSAPALPVGTNLLETALNRPVPPGYVYNANERPGLNVPAAVDAVDPLQRDICAISGGYTNVSCVPAPEQVQVEWLLNSVDGIDDIGQTVTLNIVRPRFPAPQGKGSRPSHSPLTHARPRC
jgi:hypothetical protein